MVKEAKYRTQRGDLGQLRRILVEYTQGWLAQHVENVWRLDPKVSGIACSMGDIGTHAFNLAEYVTGLKINELCAELNSFGKNRVLDDDGAILIRYENGVKGVLVASQIAAGEENNLSLRIYGDKGGLEWQQMEPNTLYLKYLDKPTEILRTGGAYLSKHASQNTRVPAGHPEGYYEAFANIYRNFSRAIITGEKTDYLDFPTVEDGIRGMQFVETVVASSKSNQKWTKFD